MPTESKNLHAKKHLHINEKHISGKDPVPRAKVGPGLQS